MSPSSRRAWIEIFGFPLPEGVISVALLAEGVDRNHLSTLAVVELMVALLAEGVDRNSSSVRISLQMLCRPPRGGRG